MEGKHKPPPVTAIRVAVHKQIRCKSKTMCLGFTECTQAHGNSGPSRSRFLAFVRGVEARTCTTPSLDFHGTELASHYVP